MIRAKTESQAIAEQYLSQQIRILYKMRIIHAHFVVKTPQAEDGKTAAMLCAMEAAVEGFSRCIDSNC